MGRFSEFISLTVLFWVILLMITITHITPWFTLTGITVVSIFVSLILIILVSIGEEQTRQIEQQRREQEANQERIRQEERKREIDAEEKIAKTFRVALRKRIRAFLRENAGEFFDAMELQSNIGVTTASEDYYFRDALRTACETDLAVSKGYRWMNKEIGYETTRRYYYYVDPNQ